MADAPALGAGDRKVLGVRVSPRAFRNKNMKIYFGHSKKLNFKEELYCTIRESKLNSEHEIIFPHESENAFSTKDIIKTCDIMIAEVSFPSTGLGIELGWADSFGRSIICVYQKGAKMSGSLKLVCNNIIEYKDDKDLIDELDQILNRKI